MSFDNDCGPVPCPHGVKYRDEEADATPTNRATETQLLKRAQAAPFASTRSQIIGTDIVGPTRASTSEDAQTRKHLPLATGVFDYFPDALLAVAEVSFAGNEQHNPGSPLHWARNKSADEADALARHLLQRGLRDGKGIRHSAQVAWRALAMLQKEIEAERSEQGREFIEPDHITVINNRR